MKYIKKFENKYRNPHNIYESGTYSQYDNNIDDLIKQINILKEKNIEYYVVELHFDTIIYFKIICFPKSYIEDYFLYNDMNFAVFIDYSSPKRRSFEENREYIANKSLKGDITKENIDLIYQMNKYNL